MAGPALALTLLPRPSLRRKSSRVALTVILAGLLTSTLSPVDAQPPSTAGVSLEPTTPSTPETSERKTLTLKANEATWTSKSKPEKSMHKSSVVRIDKGVAETYLKFDRAGLDGRQIVKAKLRLKVVRGDDGHKGGVVVHPASEEWTAKELTYANRPPKIKGPLNSKPKMASRGKWVTLRLNRAKDVLDTGVLAFRLTFSHKSVKNIFAAAGKAAPQLILVTQADPAEVNDEDKVFAHYFPPYPVSLDNKPPAGDYYATQYLTINGEGGKHRAYGGLLRDRPLGRNPLPGDWRFADLRTEVRQAKESGIDGFTVDILALSGKTWDLVLNLMRAADMEGGFEIIPTLDATSVDKTPGETADALAILFAHPSAQVIEDELVLGSFFAEGETVAWWQELIAKLETDHGLPIKFIAVFNSPSDATLRAYAPISYALGSWGYRNAVAASGGSNMAEKAHALGVKWIHTVAFQDARPRSSAYAEAGNTETARATFGRAIQDGADFIQIATWNDYSESTSVAPSQAHGWSMLQISEYYIEWFSTGSPPAIEQDQLFLSHRIHPWAARTTSGINNMRSTLGGSLVAPRDTVEALVRLTAPATVTVTSGINTRTVALPAGVSAVLVPLAVGRPTASITRGATVVKTVTSPYTVTCAPSVQDFQYYVSGS